VPKKSKMNSENNELYIRMVKVLKDYSDKFSHPIMHKELAEMDEYNKSLYFRILCMLTQCENTTNDKQIWFLNRLLEGNVAEEKLEAYTVKALEIDNEDIDAFVSAFQENIVRLYFIVDALILLNLSEMNNKQIEVIATITDFLKIPERDLTCITLLVKSILLNDIAIYDEAKTWTSSETKHLDLFEYIRNFYHGNYSLDDNVIKYYSYIPDEMLLSGKFECESISFVNYNIKIGSNLEFRGCKEVCFVNSKLTGLRMLFNRVSCVSFDKCELDEFKDGIAKCHYIDRFRITGCSIVNSEAHSDDAGMFDLDSDIQGIVVTENNIRNCLSQGGRYGYTYPLFISSIYGGLFGKRIITAKNNNFISCSKHAAYGNICVFDCNTDVFVINENNIVKSCDSDVQLMRR